MNPIKVHIGAIGVPDADAGIDEMGEEQAASRLVACHSEKKDGAFWDNWAHTVEVMPETIL